MVSKQKKVKLFCSKSTPTFVFRRLRKKAFDLPQTFWIFWLIYMHAHRELPFLVPERFLRSSKIEWKVSSEHTFVNNDFLTVSFKFFNFFFVKQKILLTNFSFFLNAILIGHFDPRRSFFLVSCHFLRSIFCKSPKLRKWLKKWPI